MNQFKQQNGTVIYKDLRGGNRKVIRSCDDCQGDAVKFPGRRIKIRKLISADIHNTCEIKFASDYYCIILYFQLTYRYITKSIK